MSGSVGSPPGIVLSRKRFVGTVDIAPRPSTESEAAVETTPSPDRIDRLLSSTSPGTPERLLGVDMLLAGLAATHELPTYKSAAARALPFSVKPKSQQMHEQMQAFCMAQHPRLGRESPARGLPPDILRRIFGFVVCDLSHLRLAVAHTEVHRDDASSSLISSQRRFSVQLHLTDTVTGELASREFTIASTGEASASGHEGGECESPQSHRRRRPTLELQADIMFEDGEPLPLDLPPPHLCPTEIATIAHGRARVTLRIGRSVLSSKLSKRRMRVRFRPRDPTVRSW